MAVSQLNYGKATLKWQPSKDGGFIGVVILDGKQAARMEDADVHRLLARLRNEAGRLHPDYVGFDGAIQRYRRFFHDGFGERNYAQKERDYKERAASRLNAALTAAQATAAEEADATRVAKAGIQTNMLSPFEAARLRDTLLGANGGKFLRGAAAFAAGDYPLGAATMTAALKPHGRVSWPIITYLPFLWDYRAHMFLKPTVTMDFADRVGHDLHHRYSAEPNADTYRALLNLVEMTRAAITALEPRDNLDIQSFIWVVGEYQPDDEQPPSNEAG